MCTSLPVRSPCNNWFIALLHRKHANTNKHIVCSVSSKNTGESVAHLVYCIGGCYYCGAQLLLGSNYLQHPVGCNFRNKAHNFSIGLLILSRSCVENIELSQQFYQILSFF